FPIQIKAERLIKGSFVPADSQPTKRIKNDPGHFLRRPLYVCIFDMKNENSTLIARQQPVEERRARTAHVQVPRRAGGEADSEGRISHGSIVRCPSSVVRCRPPDAGGILKATRQKNQFISAGLDKVKEAADER